ncbi:ribonuclease R [Breoghania sp. L-A4]|nr:ribonuclease R [Breoghania sp. L-A4]
MPTREEILAFIAENPGKAGKREIGKAFGVKSGSAKIALKHMLRDMSQEGLLTKSRKKLTKTGDLPSVFVATIFGRDKDGELLGRPVRWEDHKGEPPVVLVVPERHRKDAQPGVGDRALVRLASGESGPEATQLVRVIKLLDHKQSDILGVVRLSGEGRPARLVPIDRKQKELAIDPDGMKDAKDGDLVSVDVGRAGRYGVPMARVRECIGSMNSEKAISMIAIHAHGIPHVFPRSVIEESEAVEEATTKGREDWRELPLITIDPADAKDHDDAVYAQADTSPDNEGGHVVTVAIADVAAYVTPGSALDAEAHLRGNSVYFPDRVIPMLPERISNNLCSLREGENRPAMAVRMIFDQDGKKLSHSFHRVLMRSAAKLSYEQAQAAIDGQTDDKTGPLLEPILTPLWDAYAALKRGRAAREPLELDLPERKILLKPDGTVDRVHVPARLDAHKLIEECMIQANVSAAETLEEKKTPLLYRVHDASSPEKLEALRDFLSTLDIKLPKAGNLRPAHFNGILNRVVDTPHAGIVNEVVLRSQSQAEYSPANIGHFGLNLRRYGHFTSPIRRYADLIVHRGLIRALGFGKDGLPESVEPKLEAIGSEISATERRAMAAERDTKDRLIAHWLVDHVGAQFAGRIAGVVKTGMFVRLDDSGADGFVPASTIGQDYYHYDEKTHALVGRSTGETYQLGDKVQVRLVEAAPLAGALRFEILSDGTKRKPGGPKGRGKPPMRQGKRSSSAQRKGQRKGTR